MHIPRLLIRISILPIIVMACGRSATILTSPWYTPTPVPTAQPAPTKVTQAHGIALPHGWTLVTYTAAIPYSSKPAFAMQKELKVSAGCQPGERMVGAGFAATSVFEYDAHIMSSHPASDHTWVATGEAQTGIQLDVYCLHGANLPSVTVVSGGPGAVECPANSVLLAEGFGESPDWATGPPAYALCATSGVEAGASVAAAFTFDSINNGYLPGHASVSCPAGQIAFGGGATGMNAFVSGASADFTAWNITGNDPATGAIHADCVRLL